MLQQVVEKTASFQSQHIKLFYSDENEKKITWLINKKKVVFRNSKLYWLKYVEPAYRVFICEVFRKKNYIYLRLSIFSYIKYTILREPDNAIWLRFRLKYHLILLEWPSDTLGVSFFLIKENVIIAPLLNVLCRPCSKSGLVFCFPRRDYHQI